MSEKTRRIEIQIETHEVTVLRSRKSQPVLYCERCKAVIAEFQPVTAALLTPSSKTSKTHLLGSDGASPVCLNSKENKI